VTDSADSEFADDGEGMRCAFASGVFVSFIYAAPTRARMDFLFEHESRWTAPLQQFSAISIVDPRVGKEMTSDARARAKEITEAMRGKMIVSCIVIEGSGFFPALVRSVLAGIQLMSSRKVTAHVTTHLDDALAHVVTAHAAAGVPIDPMAVRQALERVSGRALLRTG
jgi:hypothetical protein